MSDVVQKVANLEDIIEDMQLEAHASRVAIAVLSTALNGVISKDTRLGDMYLASIVKAGHIEFDKPAPDGYREKLHEKVASLLGTQK